MKRVLSALALCCLAFAVHARTLAETKAVQDNTNEATNTTQLTAAHAQVEQAAKADSLRAPAAKK